MSLAAGLMLGGAIASGIGGYKKDKAASEAAKQRLRAMQKALQMYQVGSTDAFGNTLSAGKDGRWKYDLSLPTELQKIAAENAMRRVSSHQNVGPMDLIKQNKFGMNRAMNDTANASQGAAMKNALRSGSNIGAISTAYNNQRMNNIQNNLLNAYKSGQNYQQFNANNINALGQNVNTLQQPINNMQGNLQNMVNSLNKTQMEQQNKIADAQFDKTLAGRTKDANVWQAAGGAMSGAGQNMYMGNSFSQFLANKKQP